MEKARIKNLAKNIGTWVVIVVAILMMLFTIISATTLDKNNRSLFGVKLFKVLSDSMSATDFSAGDVIFVKYVDPKTLKEGDIISYTSTDIENYGSVITHKIRRLTTDAKGNPGFITYGTTTGADDQKIVTYPYILGKYTGRIPKIGYFFEFLQTMPGYLICILLPFLLLIVSQGITSIRLFKQYKKEQNAELEAEKAQLVAERAKMQRAMEELRTLRAQMTEQPGAQPHSNDVISETQEFPAENWSMERQTVFDPVAYQKLQAEVDRIGAEMNHLLQKKAPMEAQLGKCEGETRINLELELTAIGTTLQKLSDQKLQTVIAMRQMAVLVEKK